MDLFTYLMAKNGNNTSVHGDLFSYLLGKAQGGGGQIKTASGITIYIPDATRTGIVSFMMTKESTQNTTTGKQLFDKDNANILNDVYLASKISSQQGAKTLYIACKPNTTYIVQKILSARFCIGYTNGIPQLNMTVNSRAQDNDATSLTVTTGSNAQYLVMFYYYSIYDTLTEQQILDSIMISEGNEVKPYEEYTGGQPSPNPDYPQEVNVVEGYRNLFDKDNATTQIGYIKSNGSLSSGGNSTVTLSYTEITPNLNYTVNGFLLETIAFYDNSYNFIKRVTNINATHYTFNENASYIRIQGKTVDFNINTLQLTEGDQELPYVPYGNNYIAVNVSDGTTTNQYPIPLNNNIIAGIGDYKDELKVDKSGNVFINKKTGKIVLNGTEDWELISSPSSWNAFVLNNIVNTNLLIGLSNYFINFNSSSWRNMDNNKFIVGRNNNQIIIRYDSVSNLNDFKTWLGTHNTEVYYVLATPELIDLQTTVDINLFKGVNNISNSEDGYMTIEYK